MGSEVRLGKGLNLTGLFSDKACADGRSFVVCSVALLGFFTRLFLALNV
jgi:hypothetical protein